MARLRNWINGKPKWTIIGIAFGLCCLAGVFTALVTQPPYRIADAVVIDSIAQQYALHNTTEFADAKMQPESIYLAAYPNNQFITYVLMVMYKAVSIVSTSESAFVGTTTAINILMGSAAVVLLSIAVYRITQRKIFGVACYALSAFLIVLNPNLAVFYSDVPSLLITAAALLLLATMYRSRTATYGQVASLALLTALGALIKPPAVIVPALFMLIATFFAIKKRPIATIGLRKILAFFGTAAVVVVAANTVTTLTPNFAKYTPEQIDRYQVSATFYFGMGSLRGLEPYPDCTMGTFCQAYVSDTVGVWGGQKGELASRAARSEYALSLMRRSMSQDFPAGYASFVARKLTGAFFPSRAYYSENVDITSSTLMWLRGNSAALQLRDVIYGKQGPYPTLVRILSFASVVLIVAGLIRYTSKKWQGAWLPGLLYLSLLVFILYGIVSEFRAAYIWQFLPVLIVLSVTGYWSLPRVTPTRSHHHASARTP